MALVYFVTETFLKERTPIGENVDIKKVAPFIETAANMRLVPVLGQLFFDDLVVKYNAQTLSAAEKKVVDKCQLTVAWYAAAMATPDLNKQRTNKGQQRQSGDYSQPVDDLAEVKSQDNDSVVGRFWLNQLKNLLNVSGGDYPIFGSKANKASFLFEAPKDVKPDSFNDSLHII